MREAKREEELIWMWQRHPTKREVMQNAHSGTYYEEKKQGTTKAHKLLASPRL